MRDRLFALKPQADIINRQFAGEVQFGTSAPKIGKDLCILLFANRSGSNLVADYLRQAGGFTCLGEALNYDAVIRAAERHNLASFSQYLHKLYEEHQQPGSIFGVKASAEQLRMLIQWGYLDAFDTVRIVRVGRRDLLAQAVSLSIAAQTQQWTSQQTRRGLPSYSFDRILGCLSGAAKQKVLQELLLQLIDVPVTEVFYEEFVADPRSGIEKIYRFFDLQTDNLVIQTKLERQADYVNTQYSERFRAELLRTLAAEQKGIGTRRKPWRVHIWWRAALIPLLRTRLGRSASASDSPIRSRDCS